MGIAEFPNKFQDVKVDAVKQDGNTVVFQTWCDCKWHRYNMDTGKHEDFVLILDDEKYTLCYQKALCRKLIGEKIIISEETISFPIFLDEIKFHGECENPFRNEEQKWKALLKTKY